LRTAKTIWLSGPQAAPGETHPTLRRGNKGQDVSILQNELIEAGLTLLADGDFGQHTEDAVKAFQRSHGLADNGVVDHGTWDALEAA
jgi:peptidoglycan hydrolase-like protein with peptidoglycan-binding domain